MLTVESRTTKGIKSTLLGATTIRLSNNVKFFVTINSDIYEVESIETNLATIDFSFKMPRNQTVAPI